MYQLFNFVIMLDNVHLLVFMILCIFLRFCMCVVLWAHKNIGKHGGFASQSGHNVVHIYPL